MTEETARVRPLTGDETTPPRRPPRFPLTIAVLVVGILVGWAVASLTRGSTGADLVSGGADTDTADDATGPVSITWAQATSVPPFPAGMVYAGATSPVELGGRIYVVTRFEDAAAGTISNELWSSGDGLTWQTEPIRLDDGAAVTDLVATRTGLILSGSLGEHFAMWRSLPGRAVDGGSFTSVAVAVPDEITVLDEGTAVNEVGEIVTVAIGDFPVWREAIAPYIPDEVDPQDPGLSYYLDSVYSQQIPTPIAVFDTTPEVVVTSDAVWVRLTTPEDEQILRTYDLPGGAFPLETTPDLGAVRVGFAWRSTNGVDFLPVESGSALPDGYFLPLAWQDGFITAGYEQESSFAPFENIRLWNSNTGRAWQPADNQPPPQCVRFELATSSDRILLTGDDGTRCVGTAGGTWTVLSDPGSVTYAVGGQAGFIGYRSRFNHANAMFSPDGLHWSEVEIPGNDPYPTVAPLHDRLVMLSVAAATPSEPARIDIWIGSIGG